MCRISLEQQRESFLVSSFFKSGSEALSSFHLTLTYEVLSNGQGLDIYLFGYRRRRSFCSVRRCCCCGYPLTLTLTLTRTSSSTSSSMSHCKGFLGCRLWVPSYWGDGLSRMVTSLTCTCRYDTTSVATNNFLLQINLCHNASSFFLSLSLSLSLALLPLALFSSLFSLFFFSKRKKSRSQKEDP